ncbi:BadF/BadG/BcrA/BcrD ATPase family protein [Anaerocolumna aminovalerica]|uniref:BadF/BadG/BcrA/BcrD ATPase family protein n=1 Tax=Anaerocolumna aminovalerica TaxID=1527 RepID=UPI000BE2F65B|nr:BadF/BadG/BcrA/BcrD ATPase family protein [Anaerocolumna aminovalerica]
MNYVIGIDSGGTKFLVKAVGLDGTELASYEGKPAGLYRFELSEAVERIQENIGKCLEQAGLVVEDCSAIVCGTTGVDCEEDKKEVEAVYRNLQGFSCPVLCMNDAEVALYAVAKGIGTVVIAGTGSICFGRNKLLQTARCGGWPPCIFGDEGSGVWMNLKALEHMSYVFDGRRKETILFKMLQEEIQVDSPKKLISICQRIEKENAGFLKLAPVIVEAYKLKDAYARQMIEEEASMTFELADTVIMKLNLAAEREFIVGVWGSAIVKNPYHFSLFQDKITEKYPNGRVRIASIDAAYGACLAGIDTLKGENGIYQLTY